jgi:hypothetical protein
VTPRSLGSGWSEKLSCDPATAGPAEAVDMIIYDDFPEC